jgi:hypothetical protein
MDPMTDPSLDQLEADLAAVESAMESLDRIAADEGPGPSRAAQIDAVVSARRFPLPSELAAAARADGTPTADGPTARQPGSQLVGDRLLDQ